MIQRNQGVITRLLAKKFVSRPLFPSALQTVEEWRELIIDIILEDERLGGTMLVYHLMSGVIGSDRDGLMIACVDPLRNLMPNYRKLLCEALDGLVSDCTRVYKLDKTDTVILNGVLTLSRLLEGATNSEILLKIVTDTDFDTDLRCHVATCLLSHDYRNGVPLDFWRSINPVKEPEFSLIIFIALAEADSHQEALKVLTKAPYRPNWGGCVETVCVDSLEEILLSVNGLAVLKDIFKDLPKWAREMLRESLVLAADGSRVHKSKKQLERLLA